MKNNFLHRISPENPIFPQTYVTAVSKIVFQIINEDSRHFKYEWRKYSSQDEEESVLSEIDQMDPEGRVQASSALLFSSPNFKIEPINGDIWPNRHQDVIAEFRPTESHVQSATAYLLNIETGERVACTFSGEGLPPTASFNVEQINVGHILLDRLYEYKLALKNTGLVPVQFSLIKKAINYPMIRFEPDNGYIPVNNTVTITAVIEANHVGQFNEMFEFELKNCKDRPGPRITLFGRVIGPTFKLKPNIIEFGTVSYGFLYSQEFEIENTSEIPLDFNLGMNHDSSFEYREFNIVPDVGTVQQFSSMKIRVDFIPISVKDYSTSLYLNSDKFSEKLCTVPITATCICPNVSVVSTDINMGELFLNYRYTTNLVLRNDSKYPAKFDYVECDDSTILEVNIAPAKSTGTVSPKTDTDVPIYITPLQLGPMKFTRYVKIAGSDQPPLRFSITCICIGPRITFSSTILDFGVVQVLRETEKTIQITNNSLIPASFKATVESSSGNFSLKESEGEMQPSETIDFPVTALLDDSLDFTGKLTFVFRYLSPIVINVRARGQGTGLVSTIDMALIDMNYIFTGVPILKKFQIQNFSRRPQELKWLPAKPTITAKTKQIPFFNFKIEPEQYLLQPKEIQEYYFTFSSNAPCTFSINPTCEATVNKKKYELFKPVIQGEFVRPTVEFGDNTLTFTYTHDTEKEEELTGHIRRREVICPSQELLLPITYKSSIKNVAELPLIVSALATPPFFIEPSNFNLEPEEGAEFEVIFKPEFKKDFTSQLIESKIVFSFENNPQQYFINVNANMIFPNLKFEADFVDFGSMLKHTEETKTLKVTNSSEVPVVYEFELLPKENGVEISKIFDVSPIRGEVDVGESIDIHITFFAMDKEFDNHFEGIAVCHIKGGPDYSINLTGSSAAVQYDLSPKSLDFGTRYYAENIKSNITLTNDSDIPLSYEIKLPKGNIMSHIVVDPMEGTIDVGCKQVFRINAIPGFPTFIKDSIIVEIGRVVDEEVTLQVNCAFPQIQTNFPRAEDDEPSKLLNQDLDATIFEVKDDDFTKIESKILMDRLHELYTDIAAYNRQLKLMTMTNFSKITAFKGFILSRFCIDFGPLTLGEVRTFNHKIKVVSPYPISFEFNVQCLEGTGFSIEPSSFANIPTDEELEITVSFDASNRTKTEVGEESYNIPILFSADLASMLTLKIVLSLPEMTVSTTSFEYENTLVGQTRTQTFQIANPIKIPIEFKIEDPKTEDPNQMKKEDNGVFIASPSSGILQPASFQNIDVIFAPNRNKNYSMSFPISVKHNPNITYFSVSGTGVELKLSFEPSNIKFPILQPFDEPQIAEFEIMNPNEIPIEVLAPQYDIGIENELLKRKFKQIIDAEIEQANPSQNEAKPNETNEKDDKMLTIGSSLSSHIYETTKKFSMCVIVNGPTKSGRTSVSKFLSEYLGGFPIISLKNVWKELLGQENVEPEQYTQAFVDAISNNDCLRGFIIDGLDALPEPPETEPFLAQQMKQKKQPENPFNVAPGENKTGYETALKYIISGLSGQYVFMIALQAKIDVILKHQQMSIDEENKLKEDKIFEEISHLINMSEEDYVKLSDEERQIVDKKRIEYRKKVLQTQGIDLMEVLNNAVKIPQDEPEPVVGKGKRALSKSRKNSSALKSSISTKSRQSTRSKSPRGNSKQNAKQPPKKPPAKRGPPSLSDPLDYSMLYFTYTLGRVAHMIESGNSFQAFDPEVLTGNKCENALRQNVNSILLDSGAEFDTIKQQVSQFIPNFDDIKSKALARMIPEPQHYIPKYTDQQNLEHLPSIKEFRIIFEEPPGEFPVFERYPPSNNKKVKPKPIIDKSLTENLDIMEYTKRYTLEPGQKETIVVSYTPEEIGDYTGNLIFSIDNCRLNYFNVPIKGICLYPDVQRNPTKVFDNITDELTNQTKYSYVTSLDEFHFGPLPIGKERTKKDPYLYRQAINLYNDSPFEVTLNGFLKESGAKCPWGLENAALQLQPEEEKQVFILFHPVAAGTFRNTITFYIKDNPEPFSYTFVAEACSPSLTLSAETLDFEKLLLKQEKKLEIILKNPNRIPANWRINKPNQLQSLFSLSTVEGTVQPLKSTKIFITYSSAKAQVVKKQIQIDVLDSTKTKAYQSSHVLLLAETFDVSFDFLYPKGFNHLDMGTLKVGQSKSISCSLKNKGKYPSSFKLALKKPNHSKLITIKPDSGTIQPGAKPLSISFTVCSSRVVHMHNQPVITLTVTDDVSGNEMACIDIKMSVDAVFSEYSMNQKDLIDFGPLPISKQVVAKDWILTNTGVFPFEYELQPKIEVTEPPPTNVKSQRGRKAAPKPSPTNKGGKRAKFQVGDFNISQACGTVQPGANATIHIEYGGLKTMQSESSVLLTITDVSPKDPAKKGLLMKLKGATYVPGIEVKNVEKIFEGQHLCLRYDIEKKDTTAYIEDEQTFHFAPEIIGKVVSIPVVLTNIFPVPCTIDATVRPPKHPPKKKLDPSYPFKLSSESIVIPALSSMNIDLIFAPTVEGSYNGIFRAEVRGGTDANSKLLQFTVEGVAAAPTVVLVNDNATQSEGEPLFSFGRTLINTRKEKHIFLKNPGVIPAHVSLTLNNTHDFIVSNKDIDISQEFVIEPQRTFDLSVIFTPFLIQKSEFAMIVNVKENEKSNFALNFIGEGFKEDIVFEGLPNDDNHLIIKDAVIGQPHIATFTMRNVSEYDTRFTWADNNDFHFKPRTGHLRRGKSKLIRVTFCSEKQANFNDVIINCQWSKIELLEKDAPDWDDSMITVKFVQRESLFPEFGVTPPSGSNDKNRTQSGRRFPMKKGAISNNNTMSRTNMTSARRPKNKRNSPQPNQPVLTEAGGDLIKVVEVKAEPGFKPIEKCPDLPLTISAIADVVQYELEDNEVQFTPAMMYETRVAEVTLKNIGLVRFDYTWHVTNFVAHNTDYAFNFKVPFSIMPETGFIEAGQEKVFKVLFAPEEVDDFQADISCDIPFLTQGTEPPVIHVSGFSKRPLIHFNVNSSDYISAGRRHPDYTYELPENVKVIELFSSGIGKKIVKKFEVINPTSHPYEVKWEKHPEHRNDAINCETPRALISSGSKYVMQFSYKPKSIKTIETLYTFSIPEHSLSVPFLIVGKILPK